jgi:hypothetical protein
MDKAIRGSLLLTQIDHTTGLLKFSAINVKLEKLRESLGVERIYSLSLPAGWTCPGALDCLSKADRVTGKITDGPYTKYRCFAASMEARSPALRANVWHNFDLIRSAKTRDAIATLILASMPNNADVIRIHVGGDMYSLAYMGAWLDVATARPGVIFYAYTKSIHHWEQVGTLPPNLELTGSDGGRYDDLLGDRKRAVVVFHPSEAARLGLEIDHDDTHAAIGSDSFALLLHGTQPKGTDAAVALQANKTENRLAAR